MFFWIIVEPALMILAAVFIATQIFLPAWMGTPTFPLVRRVFRRRRHAEKKIHDLLAEKQAVGLEKTAQKLEDELHGEKATKRPRGKGEPKQGG